MKDSWRANISIHNPEYTSHCSCGQSFLWDLCQCCHEMLACVIDIQTHCPDSSRSFILYGVKNMLHWCYKCVARNEFYTFISGVIHKEFLWGNRKDTWKVWTHQSFVFSKFYITRKLFLLETELNKCPFLDNPQNLLKIISKNECVYCKKWKKNADFYGTWCEKQ